MLLLGAGALQNGAPELIEDFLERYPFGVVTSLRGRGSLNDSYRYYMGMVGSYGNRCANMSISKADSPAFNLLSLVAVNIRAFSNSSLFPRVN